MIKMNPTLEQPALPGIDMTNEEYHAHEAISSSDMKLLQESPAHLLNKKLFKYTTKNMDFGTLVHTMTLEPHNFDNEFLVQPVGAKRSTTIGKQKWEQHEADLGTRISVPQDDIALATKMAHNATVIINELLRVDNFHDHGWAERSFFVTDPETGLQLKVRPDFLTKGGIMLDIKTTSKISDRDLKSAVTDYEYARQVAFYTKALGIAGITVNKAALVFIETGGGNMVKVRFFDSNTLTEETYNLGVMLEGYAAHLDGSRRIPLAKEITPWQKRED